MFDPERMPLITHLPFAFHRKLILTGSRNNQSQISAEMVSSCLCIFSVIYYCLVWLVIAVNKCAQSLLLSLEPASNENSNRLTAESLSTENWQRISSASNSHKDRYVRRIVLKRCVSNCTYSRRSTLKIGRALLRSKQQGADSFMGLFLRSP